MPGRRLATSLVALLAVLGPAACGATDDTPSLEAEASSTTAPPATSVPPDTSGSEELLAAACAGQTTTEATGTLPEDLDEVSGLAASRRHEGVVWAIEDSLEPAEVVALGPDGARVATVGFTGASIGPDAVVNLDWEDLALAPGPDGDDWLYVADVGDNFAIRPSVDLYRFPEPEPVDAIVEAERLRVEHADGPLDAEALTVTAGGTWLVAKVADAPATVYRLDEDSSTFQPTGTVLDLDGESVTGLDVSPDGALVVVRTYEALHLWPLGPEGDVGAALANGAPCTVVVDEAQGEAVTVLPQRAGIVTVGEAAGDPAEVHRTTPA